MKSFNELKKQANKGQQPEASGDTTLLREQLSQAVEEARVTLTELEGQIIRAIKYGSKFSWAIFSVADFAHALQLQDRLQEGRINLEQLSDIPAYEEVVNFWEELRRNGYPVFGSMRYGDTPPRHLYLTINLDIRSDSGE